MHVQVLASGSRGNCALVRSGETHVLLDAGLSLRELERRLEEVRVPASRLDHIVLTHGHLDHARSAGRLAKRTGARLHGAMAVLGNASVRAAPRVAALRIGETTELAGPGGRDPLALSAVPVPHDADPTVALRLEAGGRALALVTDVGHPDPDVARRLGATHLLILEFNHDPGLLAAGPYPPALKRRVGGPAGHLSNAEAARLLADLVTPELHTLVLAHLSETNNTPELARAAALDALERLGRSDVQVLVASQDAVGPNLRV